MTTLVAAALLALAPAASWSGSPVWVSKDSAAAHVRTVFHTTTITLDRDSMTYRGKTLFKNTGDKEIAGSVRVPVMGFQGNGDFFKSDVKGTWGGTSLGSAKMMSDANVEANWIQWWGFDVSLKPGEWKSFESTLTRPLPKMGEGQAERLVRFKLFGSRDQWDQFQLAIKWPRGLVFQTIESKPGGWQVGDRGAFWSKNNWTPTDTEFRFRFYPGTFEGIGG
ncbi:MAG: hypothetical protein JSS66_18290 [Armatimonadetes bacterium]|nr:hypothetical protein [Armatimonadota bacterium]